MINHEDKIGKFYCNDTTAIHITGNTEIGLMGKVVMTGDNFINISANSYMKIFLTEPTMQECTAEYFYQRVNEALKKAEKLTQQLKPY